MNVPWKTPCCYNLFIGNCGDAEQLHTNYTERTEDLQAAVNGANSNRLTRQRKLG